MSRLPTFVVIGAMRSGTTSLYSYLREHPEIFMSREKETDYFSLGDIDDPAYSRHRHRAKSHDQYLHMFEGAGAAKAVGEASPSYLFFSRSAARLEAVIPDAKLVCILRNPVDRAYSHFGLTRKMNDEPIADFEEAIEAERTVRAGRPDIGHAYSRASLYSDGLREFTTRFPAENLHVEIFDDFASDPAAAMSRIYRFVGVQPDFVPDIGVQHNRSGFVRNTFLRQAFTKPRRLRRLLQRKVPPRLATRLGDLVMTPPPSVPPATRERLLPHFREDIDELERLIDRDLSAWRRV